MIPINYTIALGVTVKKSFAISRKSATASIIPKIHVE